jgi:hypothetical protein
MKGALLRVLRDQQTNFLRLMTSAWRIRGPVS